MTNKETVMESKILRDFFHRQHMKWKNRADGKDPSAQNNIRLFDENAQEYDEWFDRNPAVFESELTALKELMPKEGKGLEIGAGTGRFSFPLGVITVVEPSSSMAAIARKRGLTVHEAFAEALPFKDDSFDFALLITVLCFVKDPLKALQETNRVLKPGGLAVTAFINRESALGKSYLTSGSKYYRFAHLHSAGEMMELLERSRFKWKDSRQTLFTDPQTLTKPEKPKPGFGEGGFIVFSAEAFK